MCSNILHTTTLCDGNRPYSILDTVTWYGGNMCYNIHVHDTMTRCDCNMRYNILDTMTFCDVYICATPV